MNIDSSPVCGPALFTSLCQLVGKLKIIPSMNRRHFFIFIEVDGGGGAEEEGFPPPPLWCPH